MRNSCLAKIRCRRDVGEEGRRLRFHRRKVAAHIAAHPETVVRGKSFNDSSPPRLARSCKSLGGLRRAKATRRDQRGAVGRLNCVIRRRCASTPLTSSVSASCASSARASAISGISGVGEKAFERRREHGVRFDGRTVD